MPTPLPDTWTYSKYSYGTLYIWNGNYNEEVSKTNFHNTDLEFKIRLPEDVKKIIVDKIMNYHRELEEEEEQKREQQIQNVIKYVRNPNDTL